MKPTQEVVIFFFFGILLVLVGLWGFLNEKFAWYVPTACGGFLIGCGVREMKDDK